jgi:uncharacterized membrane protein
MTIEFRETSQRPSLPTWLTTAAAIVALVGLVDSVYLTAKHYADGVVPCSILEGCEKVLTSPYAEIIGVPIAALGAISYFIVFSLALLAAFGDRRMWPVFGALSVVMAGFSLWLIYLQALEIGAFCQFCLISAATSLLLFTLFVMSKLFFRPYGK